jgi:SAM-dependent methyltransferase
MGALKQDRTKENWTPDPYYERNADAYARATRGVEMSELYGHFLPHLPPHARILDAGSGSGRDTLAFLHKGYAVDAFDASPTLARLSSALTGIPTQVLRFQEFASPPVFDGIWACASLLHVPKSELQDAVLRLVHALKPHGALYLSVKYGSGERVAEDRRLFVDLNRRDLHRLFGNIPEMKLTQVWISAGEGSFQGKDKWINAVALKAGVGTDK